MQRKNSILQLSNIQPEDDGDEDVDVQEYKERKQI
jgi:hypothetical protein